MRVINTVPRLVIASYKGKVGKTTATLAIAMALSMRGHRVSMFKVGPDFIDPSYHRAITGTYSRNLDYILMGEKVLSRFHRYSQGSDIAIIEGVGGIYDSPDGESEIGSTAHLAKMLRAPVALVINGERINRTVRALVRGLRDFDRDVRIVGAVLTNVTQRQVDKLVRAVESEGIQFLGYIPRDEGVEGAMQYRHLGLVHADEVDVSRLRSIYTRVSEYVNVEAIIKIAREYSEPLDISIDDEGRLEHEKIRIAILTGRAFTFYYPETLEIAHEVGHVNYVNPETDQELGNPDLVLIGGGFPEVYGEYLERNRPFRRSIRDYVERGGYLYAECGGLMYLTKSIVYNNEEYEMVGLIDAVTIMNRRPLWYGYAKAHFLRDTPIAPRGSVIVGHEFHYSRTIPLGKYEFAIKYERGFGINGFDGIQINNAYAHYLHIHPDTYNYITALTRRITASLQKT
ncbi:cobyrinate a,c-diamide synthase [Vulcanisaeta thermophila]|uniref:cobyrinate a,c-diamide synthase n=1 Tax=Vulcanisaeta thermophila TaxID=867917 RepID=UPI0008529625|nr:cobyrinate a,c-diamide synthase [Vulcanisaeta thermophila]